MTALQEPSTSKPSRPLPGQAGHDALRATDEEGALPVTRLRRFLTAVAEAALPPAAGLEGGGPKAVDGVERWLKEVHKVAATTFRGACLALDGASLIRRGRPFASLPIGERQSLLLFLGQSRHYPIRAALRTVLTPLKFAHFDRPEMFAHVGCRFELDMVKDEKPRWLTQVTNGREVDQN